ncbi:MAG: multidrug transporter ATP-binding protein [Haloplasmataceae bacterium]|jgi:ATP-binding cassette subfamily B protein|nr:multidrug transporter ATP-binding protein [Haloplasmataceae bacterium]
MIRLFKFLRPYTILVILTLVLVYFQATSNLELPNLMAVIVNDGILLGNVELIYKVGIEMLIVTLIGTICAVLVNFISSHVANAFGRDIRKKVFNKVENFSLNEFDKFGTSTLITRSTNDITQVQNVTLMMMRMMLMSPMMAIGGIYMAIKSDAYLSWTLVVSIPVIILAIVVVASKGIPYFKVIQVKLDKLNLVLREHLTGIRVVRAFNRDKHEKARFENANNDLTETSVKVNQLMATIMPLMMLIMNFTTIAIIWISSIRMQDNLSNIGDMMAFIQYAMQIMFSLLMLTMIFVMIPRAQVSAVRINEILNTNSDINNPETEELTEKKGFVEFEHVTFRYVGAEEPALTNISFKSNPGEFTAIIGGTGSGKSTLINLLPRFYDIENGSIKVDGVDIREMNQETLRSKIGLVPQKTLLFSGTIADNLRYGKGEATEEELIEATKIAQAYEFISEMSDGFNSHIAQGGTNFSGGQKQRLSIARALVRRPEVYLFDDNFSALDFKTDAKLRKALRNEIKEATMIIVAQRVSTVMDADRIIVLDNGKIVGNGKHKDLMNTCEVYREIVSSQLSEEELK